MDRATIFAAIDAAFRCPRPERMVRNPDHCCECAEHEATMQAVTPGTVSLAELGNLGWDPVCYLSDEAYRYFMPGMARLAPGRGEAWYLDQFLFHLEAGRIDALDTAQCRAVADLLDHLCESMGEEIDDDTDVATLGHVMDLLAARLAKS